MSLPFPPIALKCCYICAGLLEESFPIHGWEMLIYGHCNNMSTKAAVTAMHIEGKKCTFSHTLQEMAVRPFFLRSGHCMHGSWWTVVWRCLFKNLCFLACMDVWWYHAFELCIVFHSMSARQPQSSTSPSRNSLLSLVIEDFAWRLQYGVSKRERIWLKQF